MTKDALIANINPRQKNIVIVVIVVFIVVFIVVLVVVVCLCPIVGMQGIGPHSSGLSHVLRVQRVISNVARMLQ